jgi:hypothetical protein
MRILLVLTVIIVFGALLVIDTAALLRLGLYCVSGGCGIPPTWIAIGGGGLALGAWLLVRRRRANVKIARVKRTARPRPSRGKTAARGKPKRAKQ